MAASAGAAVSYFGKTISKCRRLGSRGSGTNKKHTDNWLVLGCNAVMRAPPSIEIGQSIPNSAARKDPLRYVLWVETCFAGYPGTARKYLCTSEAIEWSYKQIWSLASQSQITEMRIHRFLTN